MIKFYYNLAPNPTKVALFLEEAQLPYEPIPVDTRKGEQFAPAFLAINPNAKVPAIVDGDVTVFDSNAILLYLAEKTGKFLPPNTPAARGPMLSWLMFIARASARSRARPCISAITRRSRFHTRPTAISTKRTATGASSTRGSASTATCLARLHVRRHGVLGLGATGALRARRRRVDAAAERQAAVRRDQRASGRATSARAQGPAHIQGRDGRGGAKLHVSAERAAVGRETGTGASPQSSPRRRGEGAPSGPFPDCEAAPHPSPLPETGRGSFSPLRASEGEHALHLAPEAHGGIVSSIATSAHLTGSPAAIARFSLTPCARPSGKAARAQRIGGGHQLAVDGVAAFAVEQLAFAQVALRRGDDVAVPAARDAGRLATQADATRR